MMETKVKCELSEEFHRIMRTFENNLRLSFSKLKEDNRKLKKQLLILHSRLSNLENKAYDSATRPRYREYEL